MRKQFLTVTAALILAAICAGCAGLTVHRVPPGQSLSVALARKALPIEQPRQYAALVPVPGSAGYAAVEPELPGRETEQLADLITTANFCMEAGKTKEAIAAYEEAVRLKPDFAEARYNLAVLYQRVGEEEKSAEAFRKFKDTAQH